MWQHGVTLWDKLDDRVNHIENQMIQMEEDFGFNSITKLLT